MYQRWQNFDWTYHKVAVMLSGWHMLITDYQVYQEHQLWRWRPLDKNNENFYLQKSLFTLSVVNIQMIPSVPCVSAGAGAGAGAGPSKILLM